MTPEQLTRRVHQELAEERASHGHGSAAAIDERLGKCEGYLGRVLRGEVKLQVRTLFDALDVLETDAVDFFARAVGVRIRPGHLLRRLERTAAGEGSTVLNCFELTVANGSVDLRVADDAPGLEVDELPQALKELDEQRFSEPADALPLAERAVIGAARYLVTSPGLESSTLMAQSLGVLSALYRVQAQFSLAARGLRLALQLSDGRKMRQVRADLLQRVCYLLGDQGEYEIAAEVARQASDLYLLHRDLTGVGRALVDRAIMLQWAGDLEGAVEAYLSGLEYLPDEAWTSRCSVFGNLGWIYVQGGNLKKATVWATQAIEAHQTREGHNWSRLVWLQGEIALGRHDLEAAEEALRKAGSALTTHGNPFDIAVVSLRLAKAVLMAGKVREMHRIAADMLRLLKPLRKHKVATAAIHEFTRAALAGEVTVELIERGCEKLKRESPCWGSRMGPSC